VTTYVCPAEAFPTRVRGTYHGISAAAGKVGAVIGTFMFQPIVDAWGVVGVLWVQVALSILGAVASVALLPASPAEDEEGGGGDDGFVRLGGDEDGDDERSAQLLDA